MQISSTIGIKQNIHPGVTDDGDELSYPRGAEEIVDLDDDIFPWIEGEEPPASDDLCAADFTDVWLEHTTSKEPSWRRLERYNELRQLGQELDFVGSVTENHVDIWHRGVVEDRTPRRKAAMSQPWR